MFLCLKICLFEKTYRSRNKKRKRELYILFFMIDLCPAEVRKFISVNFIRLSKKR